MTRIIHQPKARCPSVYSFPNHWSLCSVNLLHVLFRHALTVHFDFRESFDLDTESGRVHIWPSGRELRRGSFRVVAPARTDRRKELPSAARAPEFPTVRGVSHHERYCCRVFNTELPFYLQRRLYHSRGIEINFASLVQTSRRFLLAEIPQIDLPIIRRIACTDQVITRRTVYANA